MIQVYRWLIRLVTVGIILATLATAFVYWFASRSLPDYAGDFRVSGLTAEVEIIRDHANVPHIMGSTDADSFYGLGFVHAQDRLWQMMLMRRTAQGKLSEMFGARTLKTDDLMRRLDIYGLSRKSVAAQDAQTIAALEAYSAGVNAWIAEVNKGARGRGAPEFFLFPPQIAPWTPADSIALVKLMGMQLSSHLTSEVRRAQASLMLPEERVRDLLPDAPGTGIAALPDFAALFPDLPPITDYAVATPDPFMPIRPHDLAGASNAFAAAPSRSATGASVLANDPHLGFTAPTIWYLARVELQTGGVIGATIPGVPAVLAGRSDKFGWAITASYMDDQDLFIEQQNPDNKTEVLTPEGYKPLIRRESIIQIKDAAPVTITLQWSDNGPILPGEHFELGTITPAGHLTALSWTLLTEADTSMTAAIRLMHANTVAEGIEAGALFVAPSLNLTLSDRETIALKTVGAMPRRNEAHQSLGRLPTPGWIATNRWEGRFNYAANPEFVAPQGGLLGNTNNKTVDRPFPLHVSYDWGDTQRVERWRRLMQTRQVHTRESFIEAQLDTVSYTARSLLPLIAADLWYTDAAAPQGSADRQRQQALDLLAEWNGEMNEHLPEPLIYAAWLRALQNRLIQDELGPLARSFTHVNPVFIERVFRNVDGAAVWCDVLQSAATETCSQISKLALDDALVWIDENWGGALESLRWGDAHQATHDHPVLGSSAALGWLVNIRQSTSGGDNTLNMGATAGTGENPYLNVHGAGYRGVYDFADPDSSVFVISTGQSGHPLSRHYDDLGELWRRGEYVPMSLDVGLARAASVGVTYLRPE